jgi:hypothetical protein
MLKRLRISPPLVGSRCGRLSHDESVELASLITPLHAHRSSGHDTVATVHQHLAPHHHAFRAEQGPEIEQDEQIVWLAASAIQALPIRVAAALPELAGVPGTVPPSTGWSPIPSDDTAPPHGPPRRFVSLRAPPVLPV